MADKLETIAIDTSPENVAAMLECGLFHAHFDGRWRYSPFKGETAYCNDPTEQFALRGDGVAVDPATRLFALYHWDGTRGLRWFDMSLYPLVWQIYSPRDKRESAQREFIIAALAA